MESVKESNQDERWFFSFMFDEIEGKGKKEQRDMTGKKTMNMKIS